MSLKFDSARNEMVNKNREKAGLPVYNTDVDRPKNAHRYAGSSMSDKEIAEAQNDTAWLERNGYATESENQAELENQADSEIQEKEIQTADLVTNHIANMTDKMSNFKGVLDKLNAKFCQGRPVYTMYFKMNLRGLDGIDGVLVDTTSKDWLENCFISFTHKMNGSGEANTFTLDIIFKPNDRNVISIMALESKLLAACAITNKDYSLKDEDYIYCNTTFQYGYGDDESLRSPTYYGTIMDYDSKIENGNLRYTITGYSGLYSATEYRISPKEEYLTDSTGATISDPMSYIRRIFEVEFKNNEFVVEFVNIDINTVKYPGDTYKQFCQKNIFSVVKDILSGCMTTEQYNAMSGSSGIDSMGPNSPYTKSFLPNQKQIFSYYIDDKPSDKATKGTVYIYKMDSLQGEENANKTVESISADCGIDFGWFAPTGGAYNHIVKDWHPQYEGSILMALATTYICNDKDTTFYTQTDNGDIKTVTGFGAARLGASESDVDKAILSTIQEYDNWSFVTQYPYKANMTIIGAPCEVPMTGKIKVTARIGNEVHHSSGIYMVLGKTDKISSGGFFSDFELFKITPGFNPEYLSVKDDEESEKDVEVSELEKAMWEQGLGMMNPDNYMLDENGNVVEKIEISDLLGLNR